MQVMDAVEHLEHEMAAQAMRDFPGYAGNAIYLEPRPARTLLPDEPEPKAGAGHRASWVAETMLNGFDSGGTGDDSSGEQ